MGGAREIAELGGFRMAERISSVKIHPSSQEMRGSY
jgi:hypothetical protein